MSLAKLYMAMAAVSLVFVAPALAQTPSNFGFGSPLGSSALNAEFASKLDTSSPTFSGTQTGSSENAPALILTNTHTNTSTGNPEYSVAGNVTVTVNNARAYGIHSVVQDQAGVTGAHLIGAQSLVLTPNAYGSVNSVFGYVAQGHFGSAAQTGVWPGVGIRWELGDPAGYPGMIGVGFATTDGSAQFGLQLGAACQAGVGACAGQPILMGMYDGSNVLHNAQIDVDNAGDIRLIPTNGGYTSANGGLSVAGGGVTVNPQAGSDANGNLVALQYRSGGVVSNNSLQSDQFGNLIVTAAGLLESTGPIRPPKTTVAGLSSFTCNASNTGGHVTITDASSPTWHGTLTGGSSTVTDGICNGSAWIAD